MKIFGKRFADALIDYGDWANFAMLSHEFPLRHKEAQKTQLHIAV